MGAWIETLCIRVLQMLSTSHPTWVRGLKQKVKEKDPIALLVAPYMGAWIETIFVNQYRGDQSSHPTWVRGLKQQRMND